MKYPVLLMTALASAVFLAGCSKSDQSVQQAAAAQQMPPSVVNVLPVQFQSVPLVKELSGKTVAYQEAIVTPQVSGIIDEQLFRDGAFVKRGQPLYRLNKDNYSSTLAGSRASYEQAVANIGTAEANLESQRTQLALARANLARLEMLKGSNAISKQEYDTGVATVRSAEAAVKNAQAQIVAAQKTAAAAGQTVKGNQLNMDRTVVTAPMSGQTERSKVNVGTLASAGQTQMVTISQLNPIYVDISQSSAEMLALRSQMMNGNLSQASSAQVRLKLSDGSTYPVIGQLRFEEAKVDSHTGTVNLRAVFDNDEFILLPGMMVRAEVIQGVVNNAVLLPQSAINRTAKGDTTVYIVDANKKIQVRPVKTSGTYEGQWVVTDGLKQGENVVVVGGAKVKPDQQVEVKPYVPDSSGQAGQNANANMNAPVASSASASQPKP
ncbi:efflux RND transporter periplasmic adaptor subunit [Faucicola mancuniensis]|uniref:efflux RND transporter periplasmic adaptor subunit n=1 Tax=Faucicola mancuniensis TaxID=1309795 RepID=UPI003977B57B